MFCVYWVTLVLEYVRVELWGQWVWPPYTQVGGKKIPLITIAEMVQRFRRVKVSSDNEKSKIRSMRMGLFCIQLCQNQFIPSCIFFFFSLKRNKRAKERNFSPCLIFLTAFKPPVSCQLWMVNPVPWMKSWGSQNAGECVPACQDFLGGWVKSGGFLGRNSHLSMKGCLSA